MLKFLKRLFGQHTYGAELSYRIGDVSYYVAVDTTDFNRMQSLLDIAKAAAERATNGE